jgi:sigma-B regulation protein RsbQ
MNKYTVSSDGLKIHYQIAGKGSTAIIFVHGWLGNMAWWDSQKKYFSERYTVVLIDLPGHGKSDRSRQVWSSEQYADDIRKVAFQTDADTIILVGHSMSGAYILEASLNLPKVKALIPVDTLKDMDQFMDSAQAEQYIFSEYRRDFKSAVENLLPQYLFAGTTPVEIQKQLKGEFIKNDPELVIKALEPLYKTDFRKIAKLVHVPVRSINSDFGSTNIDNNRKYLSDFDYVTIKGTGHYPMLEQPEEFNRLLDGILEELSF